MLDKRGEEEGRGVCDHGTMDDDKEGCVDAVLGRHVKVASPGITIASVSVDHRTHDKQDETGGIYHPALSQYRTNTPSFWPGAA